MTAHALLVSPLYVGICALILAVLAIPVMRRRGLYKVDLGDGGRPELLRAIRVHGNFIEYVPLALLVIVLLEATGHSLYLIHVLGIALVAGRLLHVWGLSTAPGISFGRAAGVLLTFAVLIVGGVLLILTFMRNLAVM